MAKRLLGKEVNEMLNGLGQGLEANSVLFNLLQQLLLQVVALGLEGDNLRLPSRPPASTCSLTPKPSKTGSWRRT